MSTCTSESAARRVGTAMLALAFIFVAAAAFAQAPQTKPPAMPRSADGHPDLQGIWAPVVDGASHSVEEGPEPENAAINGSNRKPQTIVLGEGELATLPYQAWAAAKRVEHMQNLETPTSWDDIDPEDRCLPLGMPRSNYRGNVKIVQTTGHVTMLYEWNHGFRDVRTDGSRHPAADVKLWNGDSRGRWEGDTLVVDVTNFFVDPVNYKAQPWLDSHGSFYSDALHVVERWTPVDADTIRFEATIEDPNVFTRPWKLGFNMRRNKQPGFELLEEACFEGERNSKTILQVGRKAKAAGQTGIHSHGLTKSK